uniref:Uncharacterized protein n=1 Tax=Arundo donax TaxID=35708 RepID=A0A0A9HH04_ARUDO
MILSHVSRKMMRLAKGIYVLFLFALNEPADLSSMCSRNEEKEQLKPSKQPFFPKNQRHATNKGNKIIPM